MSKKAEHLVFIHLFQSFFSVWALMKASRMEPGNILTLVFFLLIFFFYQHVNRRPDRRTNRVSLTLSVIFTLFYMLVDYPHYIEQFTSRLYRFLILAAVFYGFAVLFYYLLNFLFSYTCDKARLSVTLLADYSPACYIHPEHPKLSAWFTRIARLYKERTFLCTFFLCILGWLPYYLYQYPGIMTPDSINQLEQVLGLVPYSNHHPWAHTLLFGFFYQVGYALTGNMVAAVSFYTFFQMCLLAGASAFLIKTLRARKVRPLVLLLITAFYALIPYHAVFSVTVWKDIPFAAAVMYFSCALVRLIFSKNVRFPDLLLFIISGVMICLFRSNGWYAFLLLAPFLLFAFRRRAKTFYPALLLIFCAALCVKHPAMKSCEVEQPDFIESVCIPMQQITAVICNDRALTEEELSLIEHVVDLTYIHELYNPTFADNIKELVRAGNQDYLVSHKKEFFRLWVDLGLRYPGDYLDAYVKQTYGYWYPDSFYLVAEAEGVSATDLGVSHTPLIGGPLVVKGKEIAVKLGGILPLYGTLWSMGVAFWILLFCIGTVILRREYQKLPCFLPGLALLFTVLIATPVATEFRYVYFLVFCLPFYLTAAVLPCPENAKSH